MSARAVALVVLAVACGNRGVTTATSQGARAPSTLADRVIAVLPQGAQLVVEIDLARLRANPVIGATVARALDAGAIATLPGGVPVSPLASADLVVLAAWGVGTPNAASVTVLAVNATSAPAEAGSAASSDASDRVRALAATPNAIRLTDEMYALGPTEWIAQLEQRATLTLSDTVIAAPAELLALRARAMPPKAPGASLRLTARLPADARVALAREMGLAIAPAQLSVWGDVVDDFGIICDAGAADPGEPATKQVLARLEATLRMLIGRLAEEPAARSLGVSSSLLGARLVAKGPWLRVIVEIGPTHLQRVVARANELLSKSPAAPQGPS